MTRYYLFQDEDSNSNKYWEISVEKEKQVVSFGRVGSVGTSKEKKFPTEELCLSDSLKQIKEKMRKGYIEIEKSLKITDDKDASPNEKIANYLNIQFECYSNKLKAMVDVHPLFKELLNDLEQYDFESYRKKAAQEIENNVTEWWINPLKGINQDLVLDSILLEYDNCFTGAYACAYGIIDWEQFKRHTKGFSMGYNYDFAGGFESMPAITLDYFYNLDKLDDTNLPSDIDSEDIYDFVGYEEVLKAYFFAGLVALNHVFTDLDNKNVFNKINAKKGFMFIIGEHDSGEVFPIYAIN